MINQVVVESIGKASINSLRGIDLKEYKYSWWRTYSIDVHRERATKGGKGHILEAWLTSTKVR